MESPICCHKLAYPSQGISAPWAHTFIPPTHISAGEGHGNVLTGGAASTRKPHPIPPPQSCFINLSVERLADKPDTDTKQSQFVRVPVGELAIAFVFGFGFGLRSTPCVVMFARLSRSRGPLFASLHAISMPLHNECHMYEHVYVCDIYLPSVQKGREKATSRANNKFL